MPKDHSEERPLSTREEWMLVQRGEGWTYGQIGADHGVSAGRVGQIMRGVREKLGVSTDEEAIAEARRRLTDAD
ncbi:sigma factor-like helix-turn-helix DNA-binding protein [Streptomyces sp. NPDC020489]|uniref:sigma factor-like helix-turn-helix DNA-binding protein n=1 Tax=Streptomyces sp. NPDC020489 TaxID=3365077 RepID=UPI0037B09683